MVRVTGRSLLFPDESCYAVCQSRSGTVCAGPQGSFQAELTS